MNKTKSNIKQDGLLAGLDSGTHTFSNDQEMQRMTYSPLLKNTIMSMETLQTLTPITKEVKDKIVNPNDYVMFGDDIEGKITVEKVSYNDDLPLVYFFIKDSTGNEKIIEYNASNNTQVSFYSWSRQSDNYKYKFERKKNIYPNYIREGLFFIKVGGQFISQGTNAVDQAIEYGTINGSKENLELARYKFMTSNSGINYPFDWTKPLAIPFLLTFISKNETDNTYEFDIREFTGETFNYTTYKKLGTIHETDERVKNSKYAYLCDGNNFSSGCVKDSRRGYFHNVNQIIIGNDKLSSFIIPYGLNFALSDVSPFGHARYGNNPAYGENTKWNFTDWWDNQTSTYQIYDYNMNRTYLTSRYPSENSKLIIEIKNGAMYMKFNNLYLQYYDGGRDEGRLVLADSITDKWFQHCELEPVLTDGMAQRYYEASIKYLQSKNVTERQTILGTVAQGDTIAEPFCGTSVSFKDDTRKLDLGTPDALSSNSITKYFERICACNMSTSPEGFYQQKMCSDKFIKDNYGIDDKSKYKSIRDNLKCSKPNCSFEKCVKVYSEPENLTIKYTPTVNDECGGSTMCIINQKFENNGNLIGGTIKMTGTQTCGGAGGGDNGVQTKTGTVLEWISIPKSIPTMEELKSKKINIEEYEMYGAGINNNQSSIPITRADFDDNNINIIYFATQDGIYTKMVSYNSIDKSMAAYYYEGSISLIHTPQMPAFIPLGSNYLIRRK